MLLFGHKIYKKIVKKSGSNLNWNAALAFQEKEF